MKKLFAAILLFTGFSAAAQPQALGKNDPQAKAILDAVSAKFRVYKAVTANFSLKVENAAGRSQGSKSGVVNMKGTKYRVNVTGQEIFCDGVNIWTYDRSAGEVQITKFDNSTNTITPQKLFTNFYDKDFLYKLNGETKQGAKVYQEIELTPIDKTKPFFKVLITVDKAAKSIVKTKIFEKNGNRYTYSITKMITNGNLPDALFNFDVKKYPGVEVVDLR